MDWSSVQEEGAARREKNAKRAKGKSTKQKQQSAVDDQQTAVSAVQEAESATLAYRKIVITAESLVKVTEDWIQQSTVPDQVETPATPPLHHTPVFLVALHACGSLTLDVLRAFVEQSQRAQSGQGSWKPAGGLVVGCCYNLLRPEGKLPRLFLCMSSDLS